MDLIIGAGITGLSYAMFSPSTDYLILEKDNEAGGYCRTTKRNGFVWDYSGHFFHFRDKAIKSLILSKLNKDDLVEVVKRTHIQYKDLLIDYPFQKNIHELPQQEFIDCLYDLFTNTQTTYGNFQEMLYCKFGRSIAEKFLIPYNEKLYACHLNTLDKDAMGRFFPYAEKEDIIRNFKAEKHNSYNDFFLYPKGGAREYINSVLSQTDQSKIKLQSNVETILPERHEVVLAGGRRIKYDRLVSTMPFPQLLAKAGIPFDPAVYTWNQVLVFNLGFDRKGPNSTDHWIYFPEKQYCFYRVGFYDNILNQDKMSLYVELGFSKDTQVTVTDWLEPVLRDLKKANILTSDINLVDYQSILMNPAYVHINKRSMLDVAEKKTLLAAKDIYSVGRYGSWSYCSIEDNISEARNLIHKIYPNE